MIIVEGKRHGGLVRAVIRLPRREVVRETKGKSGVAARLQEAQNSIGLVDEDPGDIQPAYFRGLTQLGDDPPAYDLRLLRNGVRGNRVVVLCPNLQEWLLRSASSVKLDLERYGLPLNLRELHDELTHHPDKIVPVVRELKAKRSGHMDALRKSLRL